METIMKKLLILALFAVTACTNGLVIEKCQVHMNAFMGTVSNEGCTSTQIRLK